MVGRPSRRKGACPCVLSDCQTPRTRYANVLGCFGARTREAPMVLSADRRLDFEAKRPGVRADAVIDTQNSDVRRGGLRRERAREVQRVEGPHGLLRERARARSTASGPSRSSIQCAATARSSARRLAASTSEISPSVAARMSTRSHSTSVRSDAMTTWADWRHFSTSGRGVRRAATSTPRSTRRRGSTVATLGLSSAATLPTRGPAEGSGTRDDRWADQASRIRAAQGPAAQAGRRTRPPRVPAARVRRRPHRGP